MPNNLVLHMGFLNTPYTKKTMAAPMTAAKAYGAQQRRGFTKTMTAEKVSNILENKYNIVDTFKEIYETEIMNLVHDSAHQMLREVIVETMTEKRKPFSEKMVKHMQSKTREIERMFRAFLDMEEMNGRPGIPTKAALTGKGRRTRRPGPSFIDTGIFRASFRAWADIK